MGNVPRVAAAFLLLVIASLQSAAAEARLVAVTNAAVIDARTGETAAVDILIRGERIASTRRRGSLAIPAGAHVIDARGLYAVPGLWDAHAHLTGDPAFESRARALFIANGITSVRDMGGDLDGVMALRQKANSGAIASPHIWAAGSIIDGVPPVRPDNSFAAATPEEGVRRVDELAARGVDFIKVYEMLAPDTTAAIVARAHRLGLKAVGHLPLRMSARQALDAGFDGFEHLRGFEFDCAQEPERLLAARIALMDAHASEPGGALRRRVHAAVRPEALAQQDSARCAALIEEFRKRGAWQTPTLAFVAFRSLRYYARPGWSDAFNYLPAAMQDRWRATLADLTDPSKYTEWEAHGAWARRIVLQMHRAGVNLLAGTDSGPGYVFAPGFALHDELQAFVDSGVPPLAALQAATINPPRFFGIDRELGAIRRGSIADIVLLRHNPLEDIGATRRIETVIARGRVFDRAALDALLAGTEAPAT